MRNMLRLLLVVTILISMTYPFVFETHLAHAETVYTFSNYYTTANGGGGMFRIPIIAGETWDITLAYSVDVTCSLAWIFLDIQETEFHAYFPENTSGHYEGTLHYTYYAHETMDERDVGPGNWPNFGIWPNCAGYQSDPTVSYMAMQFTLTIRVFGASEELPIIPSINDPALPLNIYTPTPEDAVNGEQYIDIWRLDENNIGQPALYISADDLSGLPDFPSENMLISSTPDGFISVYKLTTGEYQVNVGPLADGKIHVLIFDAIPPTHTYGYTWDIAQ